MIRDISVEELIQRKLPTLPIEPSVLELMKHARLVRSVRLVSGLFWQLTRVLAGEAVVEHNRFLILATKANPSRR